MLIKFFARGQGSGRGPVEYVTRADLTGREPAPPVVLRGDPDRTRDLIDSIDREWRYTSGVISFAIEDAPTEDQQCQVMDEFEAAAFAGLEPDQYDILWVRHQHTDGGRVELHFVTPRMELTTGKALNIAPPGWQRLYDPLRDALNYENGWARPDDPERARSLQNGPKQASERLQSREAIHGYLEAQIDAGAVYDRATLVEALLGVGLEVNRQGKDYVTALDPESGDKFRLKGPIYEQGWTSTHAVDAARREVARENSRGTAGARAEDLERAQDARRELSSRIESRARHHSDRYGRPGAEHAADAGRAAALAALDRVGPPSGELALGAAVLAWSLDAGKIAVGGVEHDPGAGERRTGRAIGSDGPDRRREDLAGRERDVSRPAGLRRPSEIHVRRQVVPEAEREGELGHGPVDTARARIAAIRQRVADWCRGRSRRVKIILEEISGRKRARNLHSIDRIREISRSFGKETELYREFEQVRMGKTELKIGSVERGITEINRSIEGIRIGHVSIAQKAMKIIRRKERAHDRGWDNGPSGPGW